MQMTDETTMTIQVTEADVIQTCEVHGFPLDPDQLEVVTAVVNQMLLSASKPAAPEGWKLVPVEQMKRLEEIHDACEGVSYSYRRSEAQTQWELLATSTAAPATDSAEDAYVIKRLSTVLAEVAGAIMGEDVDVNAADVLTKLPEHAQTLKLEVELYRANAAAPAQYDPNERLGTGGHAAMLLLAERCGISKDTTNAAVIRFALACRDDAAPAQSGEAVGYFVNDNQPGMKPHYSQISEEFKHHRDVFAFYAAPQPSQPVG
ncbi:hypothetical protein PQR71_41475, partial [Paraburkholderia fungorum]